jgi:hypothetical protein
MIALSHVACHRHCERKRSNPDGKGRIFDSILQLRHLMCDSDCNSERSRLSFPLDCFARARNDAGGFFAKNGHRGSESRRDESMDQRRVTSG